MSVYKFISFSVFGAGVGSGNVLISLNSLGVRECV